MLTDLNEIKRRLQRRFPLVNRGDGWLLGRECGKDSTVFYDPIPDNLVALLTTQGCIKTELRVVGSAQWVQQ